MITILIAIPFTLTLWALNRRLQHADQQELSRVVGRSMSDHWRWQKGRWL